MIISPFPADALVIGSRPSFKQALAVSLGVVAVLWVIWFADSMLGLRLARLGIYPGDLSGLPGILLGPLIHDSAMHLFSNTPSLLVLCTVMLYGYPRSARVALPLIYLGSGLGVWLFARAGFHIGASGLTHGMMFFIFVIGVLRRDRPAIALSLIVFFLYGGMIWGVLPQEAHISFESHFFGALVGVVLAVALRNRDPRPPEKRYDWEGEEEVESVTDDKPPIGGHGPPYDAEPPAMRQNRSGDLASGTDSDPGR